MLFRSLVGLRANFRGKTERGRSSFEFDFEVRGQQLPRNGPYFAITNGSSFLRNDIGGQVRVRGRSRNPPCQIRAGYVSRRERASLNLSDTVLSLLLLSSSRLQLAPLPLSSPPLSLVLSFGTSHFCHVFVKPRQNDLMYYEMYTKRSSSFSSSVPEASF